MKILLTNNTMDSFYGKYANNLAHALIQQGHEVFGLFGKPSIFEDKKNIKIIKDRYFEYLSQSLDEHRYLRVFKLATYHKIDIVHILRIIDPPRLYLAIDTYRKLTFKIGGGIFGLPLLDQREIYKRFLDKLLNRLELLYLLIHSIYPNSLKKYAHSSGLISKKIKYVYDPIYENSNIYKFKQSKAKSIYGYNDNDFVILWFGSMFYGKGIDILEKSIKYLDNKICCLIAGNPKTINFNFSDKILKNHSRIKYISRFIPHSQVGKLFSACDLILLPYRKTYRNDTSGVFVQATLAKKLSIVPNFPPFDDAVKVYKIGKVFKAEDPKSLAKVINDTKNNYNQYFAEAKFDKYLSQIHSWEDLAKIITTFYYQS